MIRNRLAICIFLLGAGSCVTFGTRMPPESQQPLLAIGEWLSFVGRDLAFYEDGVAVYTRSRGRTVVAKLSDKDLARLEALLRSSEFRAALRDLETSGYEPGCCDVHEMALTFDAKSFGFPVCDDKKISESVGQLIEHINRLAAAYIPDFRENPFPKTTCENRMDSLAPEPSRRSGGQW